MDTGFFVCGTSQSGKTNLAKWLVKMLIDSGIRVYVFDVSRAWSHDSPISAVVQIFGTEKHVTIPASNSVIDISGLPTRKKINFVNTMCKFLYDMHVNGIIDSRDFIVVFGEAQTYLPNGSLRLAMRRSSPCESVLDVVTVGANYQLRFGLITQFPAMVDKTPVKIAQQRFLGWTWEKNDVDYLKAFVGKEWSAKLRDLQRGEFVYQLRNRIVPLKTERFGQSNDWYTYRLPEQVYSNAITELRGV